MSINKIALGTVQFGIPYGINNSNGKVDDESIKEIFSIAGKSGIEILDTASAYGDAEKKIGQFTKSQFKIVTKFPIVKNTKALKDQLENSLLKLKTKSVYGYLAHNADNLITVPELWDTLLDFKKNKLVEKIGYSLYSCQQLHQLLEMGFIPNIVQVPYNLFDKKFEMWLPKLKKLGTEIHTRSTFLQGLYFMDPEQLPKRLVPLKFPLQELHQCCKSFGVSVNSAALNFVIENPSIDFVLIGIDTRDQLIENIDRVSKWQHNKELFNCVSKINVINEELLNPVNWQK